MNLEALVLLETPEVRRLVATWPRVKGDTEQQKLTAWSELSAVHPRMVRKWYKPLLENEIITAGGEISPVAAEYIGVVAFSIARASRGAKKEPQTKQ